MTSAVADVDPVAIVVAALRGSAVVAEHFGGPDHVSGLNEPPYPHLRVAPSPNGEDGRYLWFIVGEVLVEAWGHPGGQPGPAALRRLLYLALTDLAGLPSRPAMPGAPVVVDIQSAASAAWLPDAATGQPRWSAAVRIDAHPPR